MFATVSRRLLLSVKLQGAKPLETAAEQRAYSVVNVFSASVATQLM